MTTAQTMLNLDARRVLRDADVTASAYIRSWSADGIWRGDACGCPDDRCIGHHHEPDDPCGCIRVILTERNAPDSAATEIEGNDPTPEGEIMNTVHPAADMTWNITEADLDTVVAYGPGRMRRKLLRFLTAADCWEIAAQVDADEHAAWARQAHLIGDHADLETAFRGGAMTPRPYPLSVYRHVSTEPVEYTDGTTAPPLTIEIVERIASTKPDWAEFENTDIECSPLTEDMSLTEVTWTWREGDVAVMQDIVYSLADGAKIRERSPHIRSWTEEFPDATDAAIHAANLEDASRLLARIEDSRTDPDVTVAEYCETLQRLRAEGQSVVSPEIPLPIKLPKWASLTRVSDDDWPNINIEMISAPIIMGDVHAHWEQNVAITVADDAAPDGSVQRHPPAPSMTTPSPSWSSRRRTRRSSSRRAPRSSTTSATCCASRRAAWTCSPPRPRPDPTPTLPGP